VVLGDALVNLNGPEQTGCSPKSSPAASVALGGRIIPARSVRIDSKGEEGDFSTSFAVSGSTTSKWSIMLISPRR
jgi:hypothetical protein